MARSHRRATTPFIRSFYVARRHSASTIYEGLIQLGYTIGNDVTANNVHGRDNHLARSKSFDTWSPTGPVLVTDLDTTDLAIRLWVNGELAADERTSDTIWDVPRVLSEITRVMTLLPGDRINTGVPMYITQELRIIKPGEVMDIEIEGIGRLRNPAVAE